MKTKEREEDNGKDIDKCKKYITQLSQRCIYFFQICSKMNLHTFKQIQMNYQVSTGGGQ